MKHESTAAAGRFAMIFCGSGVLLVSASTALSQASIVTNAGATGSAVPPRQIAWLSPVPFALIRRCSIENAW